MSLAEWRDKVDYMQRYFAIQHTPIIWDDPVPTPQPQPSPAFLPLEVGKKYKNDVGMVVEIYKDSDRQGDMMGRDPASNHCGHYSQKTGKRYQSSSGHLVSLADAVTTTPSESYLPLAVGGLYRSRSGQMVTVLTKPDPDGDVSCCMVGADESFYVKSDTGHYSGEPDNEATIVGPWLEPTSTATPTPAVTTAMPNASGLLNELLKLNATATEACAEAALKRHMAQFKDEMCMGMATRLAEPIREMVGKAVAENTTVKEMIVRDKVDVRTIASPHPALEEAAQISRAINNMWLCGPAGSGKTTLAHQLAQALGLNFSFISCTAGMSEAKLLGRMNVQGAYLPAEFVNIYENGGVFLWDEFDAADPNVVLCANAAMANGHLSVPDRVAKPVATRHPDTLLVVATNTWGRGSTSEYTARETLDAATRDRFVLSKIAVEYAPTIEWQYLGNYILTPTNTWTAPKFRSDLPNVFNQIRSNITKHHLRRVMSTRAFAQGAALRKLGWTDQRIIERYFLDWTEAERTKALEGIAC